MKKKKFVGLTALLPLALFDFVSLPVYAEVTDFQTVDTSVEETSAECEVIYKSTYDFTEEIPKYPELDVTASGYEGIYDGKPHGITVDCRTERATILYSTDGKTYSAKKPEYTDVGTYVTYYKVEKDGYTTTTGSEIVKIKEAAIEYDADDIIAIYDGKEHSIDISVKTDGCKILYSTDGINYSSKKPAYIDVGTYTIYYKIEKDGHTTIVGSAVVKIKEATIEYDVDDCIVYYDGKKHGIDVSVITNGCKILYSEDGINYSTKKPEYTDIGTYTTYYKIEKDGYTTIVGSATVKIKEATIEYDVDDSPVFYDGKEHSIDVSVKTDGCKILYSEDGINYSSKKPEYKEPGTYTIYYKIMKDNYETVIGSSTLTINKRDGGVNSNHQNNNNQNDNNQNSNNQNNNSQNNGQNDGNADLGINKVQTGDESHIFFYAVMLIASAFGLLKNRKREEKRKL